MTTQHLESPAQQAEDTQNLFHIAVIDDIERCIEAGEPVTTLCGIILNDLPEWSEDPQVCSACEALRDLFEDLEEL